MGMRSAGFTLLEVLVAVAILGIAVVALLNAQSENLRTQQELRDRAFALVVAENRLAEALIDPEPLEFGGEDGSETLASQSWNWRQTVERTADQDLLRVTVGVSRPGESQILAEVSAFGRAR